MKTRTDQPRHISFFKRCQTTACLVLIPLGLSLVTANIQAATVYTAALDGATEFPPNASPATGTATVTIDVAAHTLTFHVTFSGLGAPTTVAHIHAPTALAGSGNVGVAVTPGTLPGFPAGVTSGTYDAVVDLSLTTSYTAGFLTLGGGTVAGAEALLASSMADGKAYLNIHTSEFPAGEIRGFLAREPVAAPEGGVGLGLMGGVIASLVLVRRRQRSA